jgi:hypothetical protein
MGGWTPVLRGPLREAALASAARLVACLPAHAAAGRDPAVHAGVALFLRYASRAVARPDLASVATGCAQRAVELLAARPLSPALYGGFTGVAWMVQHLFAHEPWFAEQRPTAEIDDALAGLLAGDAAGALDYDLMSGLTGLGVYLLARLPEPDARRSLERVVGHLAALATTEPEGVAWFRSARLLPPIERAHSPQGHFNLGLSHGTPGVLGLLARACAAGVARERVEPLLRAGARWLLAQTLATPGARFPVSVQPGETPAPARSAWCYGDPGVLLGLHAVAGALGDADLEARVVLLASEAAGRTAVACGVRDSGLCHGAAGLGHVFNRFFQATRRPAFAGAARRWFGRALEMRAPGAPLDGYQAWDGVGPDGQARWADDPSFLTGASGIGLALLAAATEVAPAWDQLLLADVPVVAAGARQASSVA